jgi:hypothetical protein
MEAGRLLGYPELDLDTREEKEGFTRSFKGRVSILQKLTKRIFLGSFKRKSPKNYTVPNLSDSHER